MGIVRHLMSSTHICPSARFPIRRPALYQISELRTRSHRPQSSDCRHLRVRGTIFLQKWGKARRFISVRYDHRKNHRIESEQNSLAHPFSNFHSNYYLLQKKTTSHAGTSTTLTTPAPTATPKPAAIQAAASAAKKAKLKKGNKRAKLRSSSSSTGGHHVLGGADYVDIMMGSRRREREEAMKLPRDTDTDVVVSGSPPT